MVNNISNNGRWNHIQKGMPVKYQNLLSELAHGLVTPEGLEWICDLVEFRNYGAIMTNKSDAVSRAQREEHQRVIQKAKVYAANWFEPNFVVSVCGPMASFAEEYAAELHADLAAYRAGSSSRKEK
jgi:hypothetical protein